MESNVPSSINADTEVIWETMRLLLRSGKLSRKACQVKNPPIYDQYVFKSADEKGSQTTFSNFLHTIHCHQ
jgi:hypothetical protein